ncbi:hypothetical protein B0H17DRAFT_1102306, partial [Mycena rosella]
MPFPQLNTVPQLYRCHIIWRSNKWILILPGLSMVATTVLGCITAMGLDITVHAPRVDFRTPLIIGAGTNAILMCLTAGRIWYIRQEAHIVNGTTTLRPRYNTAIAMILESGAI